MHLPLLKETWPWAWRVAKRICPDPACLDPLWWWNRKKQRARREIRGVGAAPPEEQLGAAEHRVLQRKNPKCLSPVPTEGKEKGISSSHCFIPQVGELRHWAGKGLCQMDPRPNPILAEMNTAPRDAWCSSASCSAAVCHEGDTGLHSAASPTCTAWRQAPAALLQQCMGKPSSRATLSFHHSSPFHLQSSPSLLSHSVLSK